MKLKDRALKNLRNKIEEQLALITNNKKIKIDKDILDDLIFYKVNINGTIVKIPVWTGSFLSKIDLSELSFENVSFCKDIIYYLSEEDKKKYLQHYNYTLEKYIYDFSNTNINIDFEKIYGNIIMTTNLSGVDLSNSNGKAIRNIISANLSNTNIDLDFDNMLNLILSDLSNNNFENKEINLIAREDSFLENCNLSNTNVRINYIGNNLEETKDEEELDEKIIQRDLLQNLMKLRYLDHCYVNDKYILTSEEIKNKKRNNEYISIIKKIEEIQKNITEEIDRKRKM